MRTFNKCGSWLAASRAYHTPLIPRNVMILMCSQERWFAGEGAIEEQQLRLLRALPIFPITCLARQEEHSAARSGAARADSAYVDLLEPRFLAPEGTDPGLLSGGAFLRPAGVAKGRMLTQRLGVIQLSNERFLIDHILPRYVGCLAQNYPKLPIFCARFYVIFPNTMWCPQQALHASIACTVSRSRSEQICTNVVSTASLACKHCMYCRQEQERANCTNVVSTASLACKHCMYCKQEQEQASCTSINYLGCDCPQDGEAAWATA